MSNPGQATPADYNKLRTQNLNLITREGAPPFTNGFIAAFTYEDGAGLSITAYRAFFVIKGKVITSVVSGNKNLVLMAVKELVNGLGSL